MIFQKRLLRSYDGYLPRCIFMSKQIKKKKRRALYAALIDEIKEDKKAFVVYTLLNLAILAIVHNVRFFEAAV